MPPLATGTSLTLGSLVSGSATATTQQSLYSLTLSAETQVYMDALNGAGYSWTLTGPRGVVVNSRKFSSTDANALSGNPVMTLVPGDYLLTVTGSTGAFAFKMLDVGQAATTITPGTLISGSLLPGQETDVYRFDVQAGDTYYFDSRGATNASAYWRLLDPFGNVVFGSTSLGSSSSVNPSDIGIRTLTLAGTYTLLVEGSITNPSASVSYAYNVVPVIPSAAVIITGLGSEPGPDLTVQQLQVVTDAATLSSGGQMQLTWNTVNNGLLATAGAWQDRIVVRNASQGNQIIANYVVSYDDEAALSLLPGEVRARSILIPLPDGNAGAGNLIVEITDCP